MTHRYSEPSVGRPLYLGKRGEQDTCKLHETENSSEDVLNAFVDVSKKEHFE